MIHLTDRIWIGCSADEEFGDLSTDGIKSVLNVAQDLNGTRGWMDGVEYAQVGLIDGPGNPPTAYYAATLTLAMLLDRGKVLVFDHNGARALAVVIAYLMGTRGSGWDWWLMSLQERIDGPLPEINPAHREQIEKMSKRVIGLIRGEK